MNFSQNFEQSNWANSVHADEVSSSDYKWIFSLLELRMIDELPLELARKLRTTVCFILLKLHIVLNVPIRKPT